MEEFLKFCQSKC